MNADELKAVLKKHQLWLEGEDGGERADLSRRDLRRASMDGFNLNGAILNGASMNGASMDGASMNRASMDEASINRASMNRASMDGASMNRAILDGATGNMVEIKSIFLETWPIAYTADVMQIGCQRHLITEWWAFDDASIDIMDSGALDWWRKWKPVLQQIIEMSPAVAS